MTHTTKERFAPTVLAVSIAAIGLVGGVPLAAAEEDEISFYTKPDSEIQLGIGRISGDRESTKFGDYTGLHESRDFAITNISIVRRGENAGYLELEGSNLGLDSRSLSIAGGRQGNFGLRLSYDELPHYWAHGYQTPFLGAGSDRLTLPPGWVAANNTMGMTRLNASMRPFDVKTDRKTLGIGANKFIAGRWEVVANFKRDEKEGTKLIGGVIGNSGGNPRAAVLPEPVDWTTDQIDISARYAFQKLQFQFGYYGSFFKNDDPALQWQNPYANATGNTWGIPAVGFAGGGFGQLALPPDNHFHQLNASAGYTFTPVTRLTGNFSIGRARQDERFLPYTVNPGLTVTRALPRTSLDGEVVTTHASLNFTTKLMPKLGFVASYRYNDRDNKTPQSQYNYIGGDSMNQPAALNTARARTNLPVDSTKHQLHTELDYHLAQDTKVKLGYEFDFVEKSYEAVDWEREHTIKTGVNHRFGEMVAGGVSYDYSDRDTSTYDASAPFLASYSPEFVATLGAFTWDNAPTQRKPFLAPRKRDKVRAFLNVSPIEQLDVELSADYKDDRYHKSELGLRNATGWSGNIDATLMLSETLSGNVFASMEHYETDQRSVQLGGSAANFTDPLRYWSAEIEDRTVTWGLGFRARPIQKLELGANMIQARSRGKTDVNRASLRAANGDVLAAVAPLPDLTTRLNRFELFGTYQLHKDLKLRLEYAYERYRSKDWAYDQVAAGGTMPAVTSNGMSNVIGTNEVSPDYKVNAVGVSAIYSFR